MLAPTTLRSIFILYKHTITTPSHHLWDAMFIIFIPWDNKPPCHSLNNQHTAPAFTGVRIASRPTRSLRAAARAPVRVSASSNGYTWLNKEPLALMVGFAGYVFSHSLIHP